MVQPYNYAQLVGGFQSPEEAFVSSIKTVDALRERDKQKKRLADMELAMRELQKDPSPKQFADFYLRFPEARQQVEAYQKTLSDADKNIILDAGQEFFLLNRSGDPTKVLSAFDSRIEALNNSGRKDMAETFKRARRLYEIAPDQQSRENVIVTAINSAGGLEAHEKIWNYPSTGETPFIKELIAEGLKPGSPEFQQALREKRARDQLIVVPNVGLFDPAKVTNAIDAGKTEIKPQIPQKVIDYLIKNPDTRDLFDKRYGTPKNPNPSAQILGGQTSTAPSGSFRQ